MSTHILLASELPTITLTSLGLGFYSVQSYVRRYLQPPKRRRKRDRFNRRLKTWSPMHRRSLNTLQWIVASLLLAILVGLCVAYLTPTASTDQQNSKAATPFRFCHWLHRGRIGLRASQLSERKWLTLKTHYETERFPSRISRQ